MSERKELVILTGVSGAGKSTAIGFMEDIGYYCVDNMPPILLNTFLDLIENKSERQKIAIVIDIRSTENFDSLVELLHQRDSFNYDIKVLYLDIKTHIALKRYKLTRRKHPFSDRFNGDISQALTYEREKLSSVRSMSDYVVDTSDISVNQLRDRLTQILLGSDREVMNIHVMSFGFKHGIPAEADFVIDVRCLPNPYWVENLKVKTGLDQEVKDYVFSFKESKELLAKLIDMLDFLNPLYIKEGKSQIVVAIGCTGGNHRSVAIAESLKEHFCSRWDNVSVNHRDINRG
ncbi:MAG: RNase adapter RapZ [Eubacterium sp.]|nr:RNase adapter RapZ [Eubacterium sp.]